jgi:lysozyme
MLKQRIRDHEGFRLEPYRDSEGILTVGYGRNLESVPFTRAEVELMFETDFRRAEQGAENFQFCEHLNAARRGAVIEMIFQMGATGVGKFIKFRSACMRHDWETAAIEMLDSKWAKQTPKRARELAGIFERGEE